MKIECDMVEQFVVTWYLIEYIIYISYAIKVHKSVHTLTLRYIHSLMYLISYLVTVKRACLTHPSHQNNILLVIKNFNKEEHPTHPMM